ncbi:MAG: hypothetical protein WB792_00450, partial [Desulfobacterales bacterium]
MTPVSHSPIPSSRVSLQFLEQDASRPQFVKNEIVKGVVLKKMSSTSVMLLIKGKRVMANTHVPLNEGGAVTLKVEKTYPDPVLKLMNIESEG